VKEVYADIHAFTESLMRALEARDPYTGNHSDRVARLSEKIAEIMGFDMEQCVLIHILGHVHDIGKIGVPDGILLKTGKLSKAEYSVIQDHCFMGYQILKEIPFFKKHAEIVLYHHERIDGKGYPHGLKGCDIPVESCIIAVADTFDAITTTRTYRKAQDIARAMEIIEDCRDTQLSRQVIDALFKVDKSFLEDLIESNRI